MPIPTTGETPENATMLIAQITDLHALPGAEKLDGILDTNARIEAAVHHLRLLEPSPDIIVVTGDLTENGDADSYTGLRTQLAHLDVPIFVVPGNHDRRSELRTAFSDHAYIPKSGFIQYSIEYLPVRIIGLDTLHEGSGGGRLCSKRLRWLRSTLARAPTRDTMIIMHHPPFETGISWMDQAEFIGRDEFTDIVSVNRQIKAILCGHLHRPITSHLGNAVVSVAPSTCYQVHLDLAPVSRPRIILEPPACYLHQWTGDSLVTHTSYIQGPETPIDLTDPIWQRKVRLAKQQATSARWHAR
ncbi:MAG: Icc protein [Gammaproteobacteria bacterium]